MQKVDEVYSLRVKDGMFVEFGGMEGNLGRLRQARHRPEARLVLGPNPRRRIRLL
jgi:hypothetical protein